MYKIALLLFCCAVARSSYAFEIDHSTATTYIQNWKDQAIYQMAKYKIPASITLAQGLLESGNGTSRLATQGNNHFGIKCHTDWAGDKIFEDDETKGECFRKYKKPEDSFEDHSLFLQKKRYQPLFSFHPDDYKAWAKGLKECGYATNPKYPQLLIDIIERYELARFDEAGMMHLKKNSLPSSPSIGMDEKEEWAGKTTNTNEQQDRKEINLASTRSMALSTNRIKYTIVKKGESIESIAKELDMGPWQLYKYNDIQPGERIKEGDRIYTQPKRNRSQEAECVSKKGETLRDVSQRVGLKLKKLKKLNPTAAEGSLAPGTRLVLK